MPTGRNRYDSGVSTDARAAGTSFSTRNRRSSQPGAPALSTSAVTPNSTAPRQASSAAAQARGTRAGRRGHHHEASGTARADNAKAWAAITVVPFRRTMIEQTTPKVGEHGPGRGLRAGRRVLQCRQPDNTACGEHQRPEAGERLA